MKKLIFSLPILVLAGCSSLSSTTSEADSAAQDSLTAQTNTVAERAVPAPSAFQPTRFVTLANPEADSGTIDKITIQHYIRGMMQEMVMSMQDVSEQTPVAVASFLYLDTEYEQGTMLGNQIAESFMHELHNFGVKVIDFKLTDYIRVTPSGDLVHSRNYEELSESMSAQYAVGGTITKHKDGVLINARMVQFDNKVVVASAQALVPSRIINALLPSANMKSVSLIKGSN